MIIDIYRNDIMVKLKETWLGCLLFKVFLFYLISLLMQFIKKIKQINMPNLIDCMGVCRT